VPERIQRSRQRGWRKPAGARVVTRPSKWGNPFRVGDIIDGVPIDAAEAVALYSAYLDEAMRTDQGRAALNLATLRGVDLCCWCAPDQPCHADVLLELANPGWQPGASPAASSAR